MKRCAWRPNQNQPKMKKALTETQTLHAGCSKAETKIFVPPQTFPGAWDGQNVISWRWSLPLPTNPVWWGSMHAISSYRGNRTQTHPHKRPITIQKKNNTLRAPQIVSAQCNYAVFILETCNSHCYACPQVLRQTQYVILFVCLFTFTFHFTPV